MHSKNICNAFSNMLLRSNICKTRREYEETGKGQVVHSLSNQESAMECLRLNTFVIF